MHTSTTSIYPHSNVIRPSRTRLRSHALSLRDRDLPLFGKLHVLRKLVSEDAISTRSSEKAYAAGPL